MRCQECKKQFTPKLPNQTYCQACREKAWKHARGHEYNRRGVLKPRN